MRCAIAIPRSVERDITCGAGQTVGAVVGDADQSSSSSNGMTISTGPNTSRQRWSRSCPTPTTTVGATKCPPARSSGRFDGPHSVVISAPAARASSMAPGTRPVGRH